MITALQAVELAKSAVSEDMLNLDEVIRQAALRGETSVEMRVAKPKAICSILRHLGYRLTIGVEGLVRIEW